MLEEDKVSPNIAKTELLLVPKEKAKKMNIQVNQAPAKKRFAAKEAGPLAKDKMLLFLEYKMLRFMRMFRKMTGWALQDSIAMEKW